MKKLFFIFLIFPCFCFAQTVPASLVKEGEKFILKTAPEIIENWDPDVFLKYVTDRTYERSIAKKEKLNKAFLGYKRICPNEKKIISLEHFEPAGGLKYRLLLDCGKNKRLPLWISLGKKKKRDPLRYVTIAYWKMNDVPVDGIDAVKKMNEKYHKQQEQDKIFQKTVKKN